MFCYLFANKHFVNNLLFSDIGWRGLGDERWSSVSEDWKLSTVEEGKWSKLWVILHEGDIYILF